MAQLPFLLDEKVGLSEMRARFPRGNGTTSSDSPLPTLHIQRNGAMEDVQQRRGRQKSIGALVEAMPPAEVEEDTKTFPKHIRKACADRVENVLKTLEEIEGAQFKAL